MPTKVRTTNPRTHRKDLLSGVDDQRVAARLFYRENGRRLGLDVRSDGDLWLWLVGNRDKRCLS